MDVMTLSNLSYEDKMAAMDKRISSRAYLDQEIEEEKIDALKEAIDEINKNNEKFYLELHGPFKDAGKEVGISSSMFTGTFHYYVTISSEVNYLAQEYYGWYAEEIILLAAHLGLGTCWVAGTYKKELVADTALEGQRNDAIIPIGYEVGLFFFPFYSFFGGVYCFCFFTLLSVRCAMSLLIDKISWNTCEQYCCWIKKMVMTAY